MLRRDGTLGLAPRLALAVAVAAGLVAAATSDALTTLFFLSYVLVGGLLAIKRPANLVSWLLILIAFAYVGTMSRPGLDVAGLRTGTAPLGDEVWAWVGSWSGAAIFLLYAALAAVFPSGRLPAGRWRLPLLIAMSAGLCVVVLSMIGPRLSVSTPSGDEILVPNPFGLIPNFASFQQVSTAIVGVDVAAFALSIVSMLARYRGASETVRLQLRWLLATITFVLVSIVFGFALGLLFGQLGGAIWIPAIVAPPTVPIAIGVAILRYRLYEIDRIVNRALVYGAVTAILAGFFAAVTPLTQRIFVGLAGQKSDAAIVLTTLAVATLYAPVRKRVQAVVDRYFKYEQRLFGAYREELRRTLEVLAPRSAAERLAREAVAETGAVGSAVLSAEGDVVASAGRWPADPSIEIRVTAEGAPLTAVVLGPRRDGYPHRSQAMAALKEVASMAAVASAAIPPGVSAETTGG